MSYGYTGDPMERDPLDMANTAAANVEVISTVAAKIAAEGDPIERLRLDQARPGKQATDAADFAAKMALVSIANDLRALREHFTGRAVPKRKGLTRQDIQDDLAEQMRKGG
jgi:hypothetical protein